MMKNKKILLAIAFALPVYAYAGIPVIDIANLKQSAMQSVKELAEMAKQLTEARNQLLEMKKQVNAISGIKGFSDVLQKGGLNQNITESFDDLLSGKVNFSQMAKKYVDNVPDCKNARDKSLCSNSLLSGIALLDQVGKVNQQITEKLDRVTELSKKAQSAKDIKSINELQANIQLEANSIALLQQQVANFDRLQKAQEDIYRMQRHEASNKRYWQMVESDFNHSNKGKMRYFNK